MKNFSAQVIHYSFGIFIPAILTLATSVFFTRILSAGSYGIYAVVVAGIGLVQSISAQWMQQGINRYLPGMLLEQQNLLLKGVVFTVLSEVVTMSTIVIILVVGRVNIGRYEEFLLPAMLVAAGQIAVNSFAAILQARQQARKYSRIQVIINIVKFGASMLLVLFVFHTPVSLLWGWAFANFLGLIPLIVACGIHGVRIQVSKDEIVAIMKIVKKVLFYGAPMMGYFFASTMLDISDRFVIALLRGGADAGIYAANYTLVTGAVGLITAPILTAAHPHLMNAWARRDKQATVLSLQTISSLTMSVGIVLIGGVWISKGILAGILLGSQFRVGSNIMPVVMAGAVAMSFANYAHKPFEFMEKTRLMMLIAIVIVFFNIGLNFIFVPRYGYTGSAWITLFSYILYAVVTYLVGRRLLMWSWRNTLSLQTLICTVLGMFVFWSLGVFGSSLAIIVRLMLFITISSMPLIRVIGFRSIIKNIRVTGRT